MPTYKHARPRGFAPWSPSPASMRIVRLVLDVLRIESAYLPLTARQVFYRLVALYQYPKTEQGYAGLCDKINRGRRCGLIPWAAIRDDGETVRWLGPHTGHFYGPHDFHSVTAERARYMKLQPVVVQPCVVEVHVEAAGMLPQVAGICRPLGVTCYSSGGFGSATTQYDAARRFAIRDKPTVVLSIGDYDPSGISLYWSWRENVIQFYEQGTKYLGTEWGGEGTTRLGIFTGMDEEPEPAPLFRRIAVTPDQIREHGFITAPAKKTDKRGDWDGNTVQCEAIPSALLAEIVRACILEHYDEQAIDDVETLASEHRPEMGQRFGRVIVADLENTVAEQLESIEVDAQERADDDGRDWTCGYTNEDEDDMEEGV